MFTEQDSVQDSVQTGGMQGASRSHGSHQIPSAGASAHMRPGDGAKEAEGKGRRLSSRWRPGRVARLNGGLIGMDAAANVAVLCAECG